MFDPYINNLGESRSVYRGVKFFKEVYLMIILAVFHKNISVLIRSTHRDREESHQCFYDNNHEALDYCFYRVAGSRNLDLNRNKGRDRVCHMVV